MAKEDRNLLARQHANFRKQVLVGSSGRQFFALDDGGIPSEFLPYVGGALGGGFGLNSC